jgi:DNA-binding GntR family transcriptional regulator
MTVDLSSFHISPSTVTLRQQTIDVLRQAIMDSHFKPGERLVERTLCEMTGVSRTSIREALRHLEAEGLVEVVPNRGPIVARLSLDDVSDLYELRASIEGLAGRLLVERADDKTISDVVESFGRLKAAFEINDASKLSSAATEFYDVFLAGCGNKLLANVARSLSSRVFFLRAASMRQTGRGAKSIAEIEQMVKAFQRREPHEAQVLCEEHVRQAYSAAVAVIRQRENEESRQS